MNISAQLKEVAKTGVLPDGDHVLVCTKMWLEELVEGGQLDTILDLWETIMANRTKKQAESAGENVGLSDLLVRLEALGKKGFVISIAYGPCGNDGLMYSVDLLAPDGETFNKPYEAKSFEQAIFIAENEIKERGWWRTNQA